MAGPGVDRGNATLVRWINASGAADRFRLLGEVEDVPAFWASLDAACLTSVGESSPYALAEAMACGVPCVATDAGDTKTLLDDVGWIVKPKDPGGFARALIEAASLDRVQMSRRVTAGMERIQKQMSLKRMAEDYMRLYHQVSADKGVGVK
jgi:glycosyltransferase involved in cell wall biosynthesis